jgi:hypothetical protein
MHIQTELNMAIHNTSGSAAEGSGFKVTDMMLLCWFCALPLSHAAASSAVCSRPASTLCLAS